MFDNKTTLIMRPFNPLTEETKRIAASELERLLSIHRTRRIDNEQDAGFEPEICCIDCGAVVERSRAPALEICRSCLALYQSENGYRL